MIVEQNAATRQDMVTNPRGSLRDDERQFGVFNSTIQQHFHDKLHIFPLMLQVGPQRSDQEKQGRGFLLNIVYENWPRMPVP